MRKILSLLTIAAVASTLVISCGGNDKQEPTKEQKINISVDAPTVAIGTDGVFTVSATNNATEDITITVTSSKTNILTITDASVKIEKGKKTVTGNFKAIKDGDADIMITTSTAGVSLGTAKATVKVTAKLEGNLILAAVSSAEGDGNGTLSPIDQVVNAAGQFYDFCFESPDGLTAAPEFKGEPMTMWVSGGIWSQLKKWDADADGDKLNIAVDNYGLDVVGTQANETSPIYYSILDEGTVIDNSLPWVTNPNRSGEETEKQGYNGGANYFMTPYVWSAQSPDTNKGKSGYIVAKFSYANSGKSIPFGFYRGWIKVSVSDTGAVTFDGMCICIGDGEFKTGQKE